MTLRLTASVPPPSGNTKNKSQKVVDNYQKLTSQAVFVLTGLSFYWGNTDMFRLFKKKSVSCRPGETK